jgi:hypothetical protein
MKNTNDDSWKRIINSVTLDDKPPGVSTLDWLCDRYEREQGGPRTVKAAIRARIAAHEAAQRAKQAKVSASTITASAIRPPSTSRPAPPPAAPRFPHLTKLESLSGDAATAYFRTHRSAIVAEEAMRKATIASAHAAANSRAAKSGRGFSSNV